MSAAKRFIDMQRRDMLGLTHAESLRYALNQNKFIVQINKEWKMINELKIGDYIEKSELDTEQKYNDVVEVLKQWGFKCEDLFMLRERLNERGLIALCSSLEVYSPFPHQKSRILKRKLTYDQVMSLKKTDVDNLNIDKVVSNEEVEAIQDAWEEGKRGLSDKLEGILNEIDELEKSEPRNDYIFNPSNINWYMAPDYSDFYIHCEKRGLSGFGFMVGESRDCGFMVCKLVGRDSIFNYDLLLEQDCIHRKPENVESKSELLKLHAAADGLIRLGYLWDEEEKAWCKVIKEYL